MRFYDRRALLLPREGVQLQWRLEPEATDVAGVEVDVQRSESPTGPFVVLQTVDPVTTFSFVDRLAPQKMKRPSLYYQLVARDRSTGQVVHADRPFDFQYRLELDAQEMIRQHNILLRGVNGHRPLTGIKTTVYKRRNFGHRCTDCVDDVTGRKVISQCRACAGTGFDGGGYYLPMTVYMNMQPSPKILQIANMGKIEDNETVAFMTNFPVMSPGDMVVEPNERHWRVTTIDVTERHRIIVHQLLRMKELDHGDVEYEVRRHVDNVAARAV